MADRTQVVAAIREHLLTNTPHRFVPDELQPDVVLGEAGLGLDSIEIVELVLACEELTGRAIGKEILDGSPLTIGRLSAHFAIAAA